MSRSVTIPAPVGGWNAIDALESMKPEDAIELENFLPRSRDIELRKGCTVQSISMGTGPVSALAEWSGEDGTRRLIACANGNIYNATAVGVAATSLASGFTSNRWQSTMFAGKLILCNGADQPQQYSSSAGLTAANYTGITDDAVFIQPNVYNSRLYFVEKVSTSIWYGGVAAITGAVTELDVGDQLKKGGSIIYAGSWTSDKGSGIQDLFVIVTTMGEVLIYSGSYPGGSDWGKVGRFYIADPLGVRAVVNLGADLAILTEDGIELFSSLLTDGTETGLRPGKVTQRINDKFREAAQSYKANVGWSAITYPREQLAIVNIPLASNTQSEQYIMNIQTGAWSKITGWNAVSWTIYNSYLFFGGPDGQVYQAFNGNSDNGDYIYASGKIAFNDLGAKNANKQLTLIKPLIMADAEVAIDVGADVDFATMPWSAKVQSVGSGGSAWDSATWDEAYWDEVLMPHHQWYGLTGLGEYASIKFGGEFKSVNCRIASFIVLYEPGWPL